MHSYTENGMRLATSPPCWPDLAFSGFVPFGHIKHCLQGTTFISHEELLTAIGEIMTDVPKETSHSVFDHWIETS
jgi:hypothetical protein